MNKAIFPGSFDHFTIGHYDIVMRGLQLFDEIVIGVGHNINKREAFPLEERLTAIQQAFKSEPRVKVLAYDNLTVDCCRELGIRHIIRGVRNMIAFATERSIADANHRLAPEIDTVIIPTCQEYAHISSSAVRDIIKHGGDYSAFIPEGIVL